MNFIDEQDTGNELGYTLFDVLVDNLVDFLSKLCKLQDTLSVISVFFGLDMADMIDIMS
jgi:hypothetical protein